MHYGLPPFELHFSAGGASVILVKLFGTFRRLAVRGEIDLRAILYAHNLYVLLSHFQLNPLCMSLDSESISAGPFPSLSLLIIIRAK